jgi:L-ascorbate metabolism protein UlaG (beta-lactamase superfamily)
MLLTKFGHSCVRLEKDGARIVIDPGIWAGPDVLVEANAVLITHEHVDHADDETVKVALATDPDLRLWASESVARQFAEFGDRVSAVHDGDAFDAVGFDVHVYGSDHAFLDAAVPIVPNTGFAVDGEVFHPGDSFTVPAAQIPTLLVPVSGPWLKFSDVAGYIRAYEPDRAYWIHDALLNSKGSNLMTNLLSLAPTKSGPATYLVPGTTVEL